MNRSLRALGDGHYINKCNGNGTSGDKPVAVLVDCQMRSQKRRAVASLNDDTIVRVFLALIMLKLKQNRQVPPL
jgi:hypothetical protein